MENEQPAGTLWTIGHSTHPIEEFVEMLIGHGIEALADVRRFPASRKFPHFNATPMAVALGVNNIMYLPFPELGGRRKAHPESHNTAWRSEAFRGYADFMETPEFAAVMARLMAVAIERRTAIMCSEAVWWRCHRGLISDCVKARNWQVLHIMTQTKTDPHPYTSAATIVNGNLCYTGVGCQVSGVRREESGDRG